MVPWTLNTHCGPVLPLMANQSQDRYSQPSSKMFLFSITGTSNWSKSHSFGASNETLVSHFPGQISVHRCGYPHSSSLPSTRVVPGSQKVPPSPHIGALLSEAEPWVPQFFPCLPSLAPECNEAQTLPAGNHLLKGQ